MSIWWTIRSVKMPPPKSQNQRQFRKRYSSKGWSGAVPKNVFQSIDDYIPGILDRVRAHRAAVVIAAPGAGKTTRVAPALVDDGPVILLQPRRVAARSIARRIAQERQWTVGEEVGWQVRGDRQFTRRTQLLVATEGILTARLQQDPLLSDFRTIILDEFHERSVHADLGIAFARQAWLARDDLRVVVMSAPSEPLRILLTARS